MLNNDLILNNLCTVDFTLNISIANTKLNLTISRLIFINVKLSKLSIFFINFNSIEMFDLSELPRTSF